MENRRKEILVGIFTLTGITIFVLSIFIFGKINMQNQFYRIKVQFNDVLNLEIGAPVKLGGVSIGRVERIYLDNIKDKVIVEMSIKKTIKIKKGARVAVLMKGVIGDLIVNVYNPIEGNELYSDGDTLYGDDPTSLSSILRKLSTAVGALENIGGKFSTDDIKDIAGDLKDTSKNITKLIVNSNKLVESTSEMMNENRKSIKASLEGTEKVIQRVDLILKDRNADIEKIMSKFDTAFTDRNKDLAKVLEMVVQVLKSIDSVIKENDDKVSDIIKNFDEVSKKVLILTEKIDSGKINGAVDNVNKGTADVVEITKDLKEIIKSLKGSLKDENTNSIPKTLKNAEKITDNIDTILDNKINVIPEVEIDTEKNANLNLGIDFKNNKTGLFVKAAKQQLNINGGKTDLLIGKNFDKLGIAVGMIRDKAGINMKYKLTDYMDVSLDYYDLKENNVMLDTDFWFKDAKIGMNYKVKDSISLNLGYRF